MEQPHTIAPHTELVTTTNVAPTTDSTTNQVETSTNPDSNVTTLPPETTTETPRQKDFNVYIIIGVVVGAVIITVIIIIVVVICNCCKRSGYKRDLLHLNRQIT